MASPVIIPLLNPNEPQALLSGLYISEGQQVSAGDTLCSLETTKSTAELQAEQAGFVAGLSFQQGATVNAGDRLCFIAPAADWQPEGIDQAGTADPLDSQFPGGLRITQPALALVRQYDIDPASLPVDTLITADLVRSLIKAPGVEGEPTGALPPDPSAVLVYGAGGHGKSVIDLLMALNTYRIVGIIDDGVTPGEQVMGLPVLGGHEALAGLRESGVGYSINAVGGIGNIAMRIRVFQYLLVQGFECLTLVHPAAFVEPSAVLADGVQVFPHAYIGSEAQVGFGGIVNTAAVVSHDCALGDYSNISPGAMLAGGVRVGEGVLVGMGATVNLNVSIGDGARIGNSAVVKSDVPGGGVVKAGSVWPE